MEVMISSVDHSDVYLGEETAFRLRDAGYPQPKKVVYGQFWYSCKEPKGDSHSRFFISGHFTSGISPLKWFACYPAYAPTAFEIIESIKVEFKNAGHVSIEAHYSGWICSVCESVDFTHTPIVTGVNKNPHEAAAQAWFKMKQINATHTR